MCERDRQSEQAARLPLVGMRHNWFTIPLPPHQCGLTERTPSSPPLRLPPPPRRAPALNGDSERANWPHKHLPHFLCPPPRAPPSLYLFAQSPKNCTAQGKKIRRVVVRGRGRGVSARLIQRHTHTRVRCSFCCAHVERMRTRVRKQKKKKCTHTHARTHSWWRI